MKYFFFLITACFTLPYAHAKPSEQELEHLYGKLKRTYSCSEGVILEIRAESEPTNAGELLWYEAKENGDREKRIVERVSVTGNEFYVIRGRYESISTLTCHRQ